MPCNSAHSPCAAASRIAESAPHETTKAGGVLSGAVTQRRRRTPATSITKCCAGYRLKAAIFTHADGNSAWSAPASPSAVTVVASLWGSQNAGAPAGESSGSQGKTQAPSPSQALLFVLRDFGPCRNPLFTQSMILTVAGVAAQELLRKIRVIMGRTSADGRLRPPSQSIGHTHSVVITQTGQASNL